MKKKLPLESSGKKNLKKKGVSLENNAGKGVSAKSSKGFDKLSSSSARADLSEDKVEEFPKKKKGSTNSDSLRKSKKSEIRAREKRLGDKLYEKFCAAHDENETIQMIKPTTKRTDNSLSLDAETKNRFANCRTYELPFSTM